MTPQFFPPPIMTDPRDESKDPSHNVRASLAAEVKRIDDILLARTIAFDNKLEAEVRRIDEKIKLQSEAAALLNFAESKRLDAIRAVDINAVAVAAERSTAQASVLANQVVASAETLRTLVASTATTVAQQLAQLSAQLSDRISALEKSSYEGIGKGRIVDPQMDSLISEMKRMQTSMAERKGSGTGQQNMWGIIIGVIATVILAASFLLPRLS